MNAGAAIAVMAAAAAHRARQDAEDAFRVAGATAPERARPLDELGLSDNSAVRGTLLVAGIVRGVGARRQVLSIEDAQDRAMTFYLDEAAILAERTRGATSGQRVAIILIGIALVVLGGLVVVSAR